LRPWFHRRAYGIDKERAKRSSPDVGNQSVSNLLAIPFITGQVPREIPLLVEKPRRETVLTGISRRCTAYSAGRRGSHLRDFERNERPTPEQSARGPTTRSRPRKSLQKCRRTRLSRHTNPTIGTAGWHGSGADTRCIYYLLRASLQKRNRLSPLGNRSSIAFRWGHSPGTP
jgi:hypothetical protein